ncbi:hypothetical protein GEMRC1_011624 [Eukaryota sp. GEM-RC1]
MDINTFKRNYSNEDDTVAVMKQYLEEFAAETHSIFFCDYKDQENLTKPAWMLANLVGGFKQRTEHLMRDHFASVLITKSPEASHSEIHGFFVVPGQELSDKLREVADFESYNWTKADLSDDQQKQRIIDLGSWEIAHFAEGKVFK